MADQAAENDQSSTAKAGGCGSILVILLLVIGVASVFDDDGSDRSNDVVASNDLPTVTFEDGSEFPDWAVRAAIPCNERYPYDEVAFTRCVLSSDEAAQAASSSLRTPRRAVTSTTHRIPTTTATTTTTRPSTTTTTQRTTTTPTVSSTLPVQADPPEPEVAAPEIVLTAETNCVDGVLSISGTVTNPGPVAINLLQVGVLYQELGHATARLPYGEWYGPDSIRLEPGETWSFEEPSVGDTLDYGPLPVESGEWVNFEVDYNWAGSGDWMTFRYVQTSCGG